MSRLWHDLAVDISARRVSCEVLRERGKDVLIVRTAGPSGSSVVVKLWNRPDWRGGLRRLTRSNPGAREWRTLIRLRAAGLRVPAVHAYVTLRSGDARHTEALVVEDLGRCGDTTESLKRLIRAGDESGVRSFENAMIEATRLMVKAGLLDHDHRLPNFVTAPDGCPVRLDFELVHRVWWPRVHPRRLGVMLGTLIGSHAFAVQPETARTTAFAARLTAALRPSASALQVASARVRAMVERQKVEIGLNTQVKLPW